MYELKKIVKVYTSKFVGTGASSCEKRIYRTAVSRMLRNTGLYHTLGGQTKGEKSPSQATNFPFIIAPMLRGVFNLR